MKSIIKIINAHFWKSATGPFFAFIFPIIFVAILANLLGYDQLLGSVFAIPAATIGLTVLPTSLFEFKNSSLLKRIGVTPIKPWMFILSISFYYVLIMIIATLTTILISTLILFKYLNEGRVITDTPIKMIAPSLLEFFKNVNYLGLIWGFFMNIIVSVSIGLLISTISKSTLSIQAIGYPILIISQFLSAQVLPIAMIKDVNGLYILSYLTPFKYPTALIINAWYPVFNIPEAVEGVIQVGILEPSSVFDINKTFTTIDKNGKIVDIYSAADKLLNLVMPFAFTTLFSLLTIKTFKWSSR